MKRYLAAIGVALVVGLSSGCMTQLTSNVVPGTNLKALKRLHVIHLAADQHGVERLIADRLNAMGYQTTVGEKGTLPEDAQAVVTYQDKWMWDITMYMLELNVQIRQPKTDIALATGHSMRTSLVRSSPSEMVAEVLKDIYK
jgi:hypothetical protein